MCVCVGKDFNLLLDNPSSLCVKVENLYTCKLTSSLGHTPRALFTSEAHPVHTTAVRQPTQSGSARPRSWCAGACGKLCASNGCAHCRNNVATQSKRNHLAERLSATHHVLIQVQGVSSTIPEDGHPIQKPWWIFFWQNPFKNTHTFLRTISTTYEKDGVSRTELQVFQHMLLWQQLPNKFFSV